MPSIVCVPPIIRHPVNLTALSWLMLGAPATAQEPADTGSADVTADLDGEPIVVTGTRLRGLVVGNIPVEQELGEADIASYGASSIEDLLDAIAPQTGSARGRGSGERPIILLNGQRISGFREIRDLPPEAIERVQIFPEELALRYGYRPDQRVVNFILKPNYAALTGEIEQARSTQGDYIASEIEATFTRIGEDNRLNIDIEYQPATAVLEGDRGIVQSQPDDLGFVDNGDFRTLIAESDTLELNANYNHRFSETLSATLSGEYTHGDSIALLGLPGARFTVPASSPFARSAVDETLFRYLPGVGGALERDTATRDAEAGLTVNGQFAEFRWAFTGNYSRAESEIRTERASDLSGLQARIAAGDPALDPFAPELGLGLGFTRDFARSVTQNADANFNLAGSPFDLPAGTVTLSFTTGYEWRAIDSRTEQQAVVTAANIDRQSRFARANIDIPLTSRREAVLDAVGDLSINGNIGYSELSDFGGLLEYGYGLSWEPVDGLSFLVSVIGEEAAPSVDELGDPLLVTPAVSVFDFTNGTSVFVDRITGGNPDLLAEERRDFKLGVNYAPGNSRDIRFVAEYIRNRSENVTASFPLLTPEIEAAFPDRVVRDGAGNLVGIDARPVNFAQTRSERIRYGINLSGRIGGEREDSGDGRRSGGGDDRRGAPGAGGPRPERDNPDAEPGGGPPGDDRSARGGGPRAFMRPGAGGGRWRLSVYHDWRLSETVLIRPDIPELDLLDGSVTDDSEPLARHSVELEGGLFANGIGVRISAEYTGSARIDGSDLPGSSDLFFDDLFTANMRLFFNFDSRENLVEDVPFLRGSRAALRIDNVFGGIRRVTDQNGDVPLSYQPGYLDALGRTVELSFRKRF
ncbi:hypothetical protein HFP57_10120 [Parasphingopyxis algicola]|uniref:hypothetical protein n=1 Tax=Parasphingopyxis algicola TaxID=2026624 RepID=UPI0015A0BA20|nr:hypothetical protein [Parasphingopyxis algicola]QLC25342.1 hypothetical protein HFP57_10120 [Parasphingopyxis algicola]